MAPLAAATGAARAAFTNADGTRRFYPNKYQNVIFFVSRSEPPRCAP
ncbi:hypothetical protein [Burkholderia sp. WAC0059]|nr:hypothetical protein [Burkholderia sp. WAC0059]